MEDKKKPRACKICSKTGHNSRTCFRRAADLGPAEAKAAEQVVDLKKSFYPDEDEEKEEAHPAKKAKLGDLESIFSCLKECTQILDTLSPKKARLVLKDLVTRYEK